MVYFLSFSKITLIFFFNLLKNSMRLKLQCQASTETEMIPIKRKFDPLINLGYDFKCFSVEIKFYRSNWQILKEACCWFNLPNIVFGSNFTSRGYVFKSVQLKLFYLQLFKARRSLDLSPFFDRVVSLRGNFWLAWLVNLEFDWRILQLLSRRRIFTKL